MQESTELRQRLVSSTELSPPLTPAKRRLPAWARAAIAASVGVPLEVAAIGELLPAPALWCQAALLAGSGLALLLAGYPYFRGFAYTVVHPRHNPPDMDTLVSLSCSLAWGYALLLVLLPALRHELPSLTAYLADPLITLAILGASHTVRDHIKRRITDRMQSITTSLCNRVPEQVKRSTGAVVDLTQVQAGDLLSVAADSFIPVDAVLESHEARLREMTLESGEDNAVMRRRGDVIAAGMQNLSQPIEIRALCQGGRSKYNKMLAGLTAPDTMPLPMQQSLNRAIYAFVPSMLLIAVTNFLVWNFQAGRFDTAIHSMLGVLFGACPCALALAVPLSMSISRYTAFQRNILIRHEQAIAALPQVTMVVFDKTGTLTSLEVVRVTFAHGIDPLADVYTPLIRMERDSPHPMARALMRHTYRQGIQVHAPSLTSVEVKGGLRAGDEARNYFIGGYEGAVVLGLQQSRPAAETLYFMEGGRVLAMFTLEQTARPTVLPLMQTLQNHGMEICLLSGGSESSVRQVALAANMSTFYAEKTAEQKLAIIQELKRAGHRLAFVGDGLNDIAAAQACTVSISVDPEVALSPYADVVINGLEDLLPFMQLAADTMRNIHQNLAWSVGYNLAVVVLASLVLPMLKVELSHSIMGLSMALSSLVVVLNAARMLRGVKPFTLQSPATAPAGLFQLSGGREFNFRIKNVNCEGCVNGLKTKLAALADHTTITIHSPADGVSVMTVQSELAEPQIRELLLARLVGSKFKLAEANYSPSPV